MSRSETREERLDRLAELMGEPNRRLCLRGPEMHIFDDKRPGSMCMCCGDVREAQLESGGTYFVSESERWPQPLHARPGGLKCLCGSPSCPNPAAETDP